MNDRCPAVKDGNPTVVTTRRTSRRHDLARRAAVTLAVLAASFVAMPAAHAADCTPGSYPPAQCTASVSATVVPQGGHLTVSGPGFAPDSSVSVDILSHLVHLKTVEADGDGDVRTRVRIPDDFEEGMHTLMLTGRNPDGSERRLSATIQVVEGEHGGGTAGDAGEPHADAGVLASTGTAGTAALAVGGGTLLGAGGLTVRLARRRRRTRAS